MSDRSGKSLLTHFRAHASVAILAGVMSVGVATHASAQGGETTTPAASPIQTVTVTAEFRKENLQNTPIAITAINSAMLEARSQTNVVDVTSQSPNVSLQPAGASWGSSLIAFIRGVGQTDFNYSTEPGVGVYVDDVYYATLTGNLLDLLDLDRVEIQRGPQGTLNGRNSIGGAIKLYTRPADGAGGGFVEGTYGSFNRIDFRGAGDFTIVPDRLFMRISGVSRTRDGYVTRVDYACTHNSPAFGTPGGIPTYTTEAGCKLGTEGAQSYTGGRIAARWVPTDNIDVNLAFDIVNDRSEVQPTVLIFAQDHSQSSIISGEGSLLPVYFDNNGNHSYDAGIDVPYDNRFALPGTYMSYATYIDDARSTPSDCNSPDPFPVGGFGGCENAQFKPYYTQPINWLKAWGLSGDITWRVADWLTLKSITGYRYYENWFGEDTSSAPLAVQQPFQHLLHHQWSEELRATGSLFNQFLDYAAGLYYLRQTGSEDAWVDDPFVAFTFIHGPDPTPSTNEAAYVHVTFHPIEKLDFSVGGRFSHDEKTYVFHRHNPDGSMILPCNVQPFFAAGNPPNCGVYGLDGLSSRFSGDRWDWRAALSYRWTPNLMTYAQMSTGFKGGGVVARPYYPDQLHAYRPETVLSYEAGLKSTWFDKVRLNGAYFFNLYKAIQLTTQECTWASAAHQQPCAAQDNVGDAHVWGLEAELEAHPIDGLEIDASYAYLHFEYQRITALTSVTLDMTTPYTPANKWSIGVQYEMPMPFDLGTVTPRIDASYQTHVFSDATNAPTNKIDGYGLVNARITWDSPDSDWSAAVAITNLADEYYYLTVFDQTRGQSGYESGQPGRPREYAFTLKRKF